VRGGRSRVCRTAVIRLNLGFSESIRLNAYLASCFSCMFEAIQRTPDVVKVSSPRLSALSMRARLMMNFEYQTYCDVCKASLSSTLIRSFRACLIFCGTRHVTLKFMIKTLSQDTHLKRTLHLQPLLVAVYSIGQRSVLL
jgi:hypothetical protein